MLFCELQVPLTSAPCLWVDNIGALALSLNPVFRARTEYIEVDYHFIREKILNKDLQAHYISTYDQPSNIFTKGLSSSRFFLLRDKLMLRSLPINWRGMLDKIYISPRKNRNYRNDILLFLSSYLFNIWWLVCSITDNYNLWSFVFYSSNLICKYKHVNILINTWVFLAGVLNQPS